MIFSTYSLCAKIIYLFSTLTILIFTTGCNDVKKLKNEGKNNPFHSEEQAVLKPALPDSIFQLQKKYADAGAKIDKYFSRQHKRTQFYGNVLFAEKGNIIFEKSYGYKKRKNDPEITLDNTFQLASITKTFTAVATLMLYEQGKLNLTDSVKKHIPSFPYDNWGITIHDLLTHRSGLSKYTHFCDNPASVWPEKDCSIYNQNVVDIMGKIEPPLAKTPGKRFYYTNTNYMLLAYIIEQVSGISYHEFVEQNIFKPLEMNSSKVYFRDNEGLLINPVKGYEANYRPALDIYLNGCEGDKGIYTNVHDMLKFDQALYNNTLLKEETFKLAMTGYSKANKWKSFMNYGYGFRMIKLPKTGEKVVYHNGWWRGFRTYFIRRIEKEQTIIILTNVKRGSFLKVPNLIEFLPN
jgi:CubicO group peptidase (beta-lactamase class C family)